MGAIVGPSPGPSGLRLRPWHFGIDDRVGSGFGEHGLEARATHGQDGRATRSSWEK